MLERIVPILRLFVMDPFGNHIRFMAEAENKV